MRKRCVLHTSGYEFIFYLQTLNSSKDLIGIIVELILHSSHGGHTFKSTAQTITIKDLQKLINYFEKHILEIKTESGYESCTFMSYDCSFQLRALQGTVRDNQEGEFSIQCMVNAGKAESGIFSTYLGGEAVVSIADVNAFITCLQTAITECKIS